MSDKNLSVNIGTDEPLDYLSLDAEEQASANERPVRIQGTDGMRGTIVPKSNAPLEDFIKRNIISPELIEIYCYAWARILLEQGAKNGGNVIVGQDPRDASNLFLQKACSGLLKAGLKPLYIGILPTPAVPFFVLRLGACGGLMLTASHNTHSEHGIKLFEPVTGLKYLFEAEERLTSVLYQLDALSIINQQQKVEYIDHSRKAAEIFLRWHMLVWQQNFANQTDLSQTLLVVDCSKGAVSDIAEQLFPQLGAKQVTITNTKSEGNINEMCGVADLEGVEQITFDEWNAPNNYWYKYQTINTIFQLALAHPKKRIIGLVFDGDGDRFFRLDYNHYQSTILISGGDKQVAHLLDCGQFNDAQKTIVSTIETDIGLDKFCEEKQWTVSKQLVGDKWVQHELANLLNKKTFFFQRKKHDFSNISSFGFEESGHFIFPITIASIKDDALFLTGNGLLAALCSLSLETTLQKKYTDRQLFKFLQQPYACGKKQTFSICGVDKSWLCQPTNRAKFLHVLTKIHKVLEQKLQQPSFRFKEVVYPEEKDLIFCDIYQNNTKVATLFVRNSGTEDKISLNLRSLDSAYPLWKVVLESAAIYLWGNVKNFEKIENKLVYEFLFLDRPIKQAAKTFPHYWQKASQILEQKERLLYQQELTPLGQKTVRYWKNKIKI